MIRWRSALAGLLLAGLSCFAHAKGDRQYFKVYDFSKGIDTYHNPNTLPDGYVQNSLNVLFDAKSPVSKRAGYTVSFSTKSYAYTGAWTYTDSTNTSWIIVRSSDQLSASNLTGSVVKVATVSANNLVGETNAFGNAYFVDQSQGVYYWNGTSTTFIAGSPLGSIITQFHNRIWVTGAAVPLGNQLYGSKFGDGTIWSTGLNPTDPVQYSVGLQDNLDNITALYVYLDTLYTFKHYAIYALYGFDQTSFQISQLTQECGCIDGNTIQTFNGSLKFLSLRGVEDFNGYTCNRISDPIKNKIDAAISAGSFSQQSWVQSNIADWNAGTFVPASSFISGTNSLTMNPQIFVDSTAANFNSGSFSFTTLIGSSVFVSTNEVAINNIHFDTDFSSWTAGAGWVQKNSATGVMGKNCLFSHPGHGLALINPSGTPAMNFYIDDAATSMILISTSVPFVSNSCTNTTVAIPETGLARKLVRAVFSPDNVTFLVSDQFLANGNNFIFSTQSDNDAISGVDWVVTTAGSAGATTANGGVFTSRSFDTGISSPSVIVATFSYTVADFVPTFDLQSSPDNATWTDLGNSTTTAIATHRYVRYLSTFTWLNAGVEAPLQNANSSLNYVDILYATSTFNSQSHSISGATSFGNFSINQDLSQGGMISYAICTSSMSTMVPSTCTAQTPNAQIAVATNTYVQVIATYTITASTQNPNLQSTTVQWFTGSKSVPLASTVWDNRYLLSLTTAPADSANDAIAVLSTRGAWSILDIHAGGLTQSKNNLYHADSTGTGNVYLDNQGFADNGAAINAFIQTKNLSLGDYAADDYLYALYPSALSLGSCNITFNYTMDGGGTNYSLGSVAESEFGAMSSVKLPFPIDATHQDFGQTVSFTIGTKDALCDWQFIGIEGIFRSRPVN